jgi:glycosyltransferase involved in cell wall biosynthesis
MTVHLVYPASDAIKTPFSIGRELAKRIEQHYPVQIHDHRARYAITPQSGDVLLGHPTWEPDTVFNASVVKSGWKRKLCLHPFAPGDLHQVAHLDTILPFCDQFLAITGPFWCNELPVTHCRHFAPKTVHIDLAVNRHHFPPIKSSFNPPGKRKFLYIGNHPWYKNMPYLDELAARLPDFDFTWIGSEKKRYSHLKQLGKRDFDTPQARELAASFDFLVTVGRADANPTTILEVMAWGLIPVCTPQSGYEAIKGIVNIPLDAPDAACQILLSLQNIEDETLRSWQELNWQSLDSHYNWDRFAGQILTAIESEVSPQMAPRKPLDAMLLSFYRLISPNSRWRLSKLKRRFLRKA